MWTELEKEMMEPIYIVRFELNRQKINAIVYLVETQTKKLVLSRFLIVV